MAALRTPSGAPTAEARRRYGNAQRKFPVWDHKSAMSALDLLGRADNPAAELARIRRVASAHGWKDVLARCDQAAANLKKG